MTNDKTQITKIEPLPVPTERNATPSLPDWITRRESALVKTDQLDSTGKWIEPWTLPVDMLPTDLQRQAMADHLARLKALLALTPLASEAADKATFAVVGKLMLAKPARAGSGPEATEARSEAYEAALDDIPTFAVMAAIRKWYRGECGKDERGKPFDYQWAPDSAVLRKLAVRETYIVKGRISCLEQIIEAVPFVDCSAELADGRSAMRGLWKAMGQKRDLKSLSFAQAIELGNAEDAVPQEAAAPVAEAAE